MPVFYKIMGFIFFLKTRPYMKTDVFRKDGILHEFF